MIDKLPWEGGLRQSTTQHGLPYPCKRHNQVSAIYCLGCQPDQCFSFWSYLQIKENIFFAINPTKRYVFSSLPMVSQARPRIAEASSMCFSSNVITAFKYMITPHPKAWYMEFSALEICKRDFESRPPRFDEKIHKASARARTDINGNGSQRDSRLFARAF